MTARDITMALSVAPMMDWTDRHCRYFLRQITPGAKLYTEMVTAAAVMHGDRDRLLGFDIAESPVALQLGGSDPGLMAGAAVAGADYGYDEININVGCPSDRVQSGRFGACLMAEPDLVADCVSAMRAVVRVPVTVKTRIGIDDRDDFAFLSRFVEAVTAAGCETLIVHARKAWLRGVSPKANRNLPELRYDRVLEVKRAFPHLDVVVNGGIRTVSEAVDHLQNFEGVMIGRAAYQDPWMLTAMEQILNPSWQAPSREQVIERMLPYIDRQLGCGARLHSITRHMLGLYSGCPGARAWRRHLSENAVRRGAGTDVLREALRKMPRAA